MKDFWFDGVIPASKSLMNRALIAQSFEPRLKLLGTSSCDDVTHLAKSLKKLKTQNVFDCGDGGTTFRFLALRVSREPGRYLLKASASLLGRPQGELIEVLSQLGVVARMTKSGLRINSLGWKQPDSPLSIGTKNSSQFLSAVFLSAWNLPFELELKASKRITSESYFTMTLELLANLGMRIRKTGGMYRIPKNQQILTRTYRVESDLSSTFSVASFAALNGHAKIKEFPGQSLQPDRVFLKLFKSMGVRIEPSGSKLTVIGRPTLKALRANLQDSPDLFPVLAALCAFAEGSSYLFGAPQLVFKESDRIAKISELFRLAGIEHYPRKDGMKIVGSPKRRPPKAFTYDPDHDHRLAMAAALLKAQGFKIKIKNPKVVNKSFPEFWKYVGVRP